jgi:hypothetical protein
MSSLLTSTGTLAMPFYYAQLQKSTLNSKEYRLYLSHDKYSIKLPGSDQGVVPGQLPGYHLCSEMERVRILRCSLYWPIFALFEN